MTVSPEPAGDTLVDGATLSNGAAGPSGSPGSIAPPEPPTSFAALGVSPALCAALAAEGIIDPFPIQALTIADGLLGRDVCGKAKTGSGKTLAFGLPLLQRLSVDPSAKDPRGLILVPTRELARQVADVLEPLAKAAGHRLAACYGGTAMEAQIAAVQAGTDWWWPPPAVSSTCASEARSTCPPSRSWSSTRPTAWPTWASCPRSSGCCAT